MRAVCSGTDGIGCCGWSDMAKPPEITAPTPLSTLRLTHSPTVSGAKMGQSDRNLSGESCPLRDSFLSESQIGSGGLLAPPPLCGRGRWLGLRLDRLGALALLTQAQALSQFGARRSVVGGHHRVIRTQAPLGPILVGGQVVDRPQMPLQRLEPLPVIQTHDVVRLNRLLDRNRGRFRLFNGLLR